MARPLTGVDQSRRERPTMRLLCAVLLLFVMGAVATPAAPRGLDYDDLHRIVGVNSPSIAPSGASVVYVRSTIDWKNDRRDNELVLVNIKDGTSRVLTRDRIGANAPHFAPDGTAI